MTEWLFDTLVWTGALIALVLVLRRPVTRLFGPRIAYALWALPFIRLILPPLVLPAWMAPQQTAPLASEPAPAIDPAMLQLGENAVIPHSAAPQAEFFAADPAVLTAVTLAVWLTGAAVFLTLRFHGYWKMREEMLTGAKEVGFTNGVRLLETPKATAPLAFGVRDKVVALPPGFLGMYDREVRDLAVAHELAHHRGGDLLVNMVMQPLFALHWFNPLGHYGWQALRRDQEAACDARVVEHCHEKSRADYARVIASFAAGPNVALAAPMACPVLGEKSIIERLRSLKMSKDTTRRRSAGRVLLVGALVALPLTATVSYAEAQSVEEAFAEESAAAPAPPAPPAPPSAPYAPDAPNAPTPPEAPHVDDETHTHKDVHRTVEMIESGDGTIQRKERVFIVQSDGRSNDEELKRVLKEARASDKEALRARMEAMREVKIALAESADARKTALEALDEVRIEMKNMQGQRTVVEMRCESDEVASEKIREDGTKVVMICESKIMGHALEGLKEARAEIAQDKDMDAEIRVEVLRSLDQEITNWNGREAGA